MEKSYIDVRTQDDPVGVLAEDLIGQAFDRMVTVLSPDPEKITHGSTFMLTTVFAHYISAHQALVSMAVKISGDEKAGEEMTEAILVMVKEQLASYGEVAEKILKGQLNGN